VQAIRVAQLKPRDDVLELRGVAIGDPADVDGAGLHSVGGLLGVTVFAELDDVRVAGWLRGERPLPEVRVPDERVEDDLSVPVLRVSPRERGLDLVRAGAG
jgi:hypothetical protein